MTQEDKELLLQDLCARLPYKIKIKFAFNKDIEKNNNLIYVSDDEQSYIHNGCMVLTEDNIKYVFNNWLDEYKPYLRPMSSMTVEEHQDWIKYSKADYDCEFQPEPTFDFESCWGFIWKRSPRCWKAQAPGCRGRGQLTMNRRVMFVFMYCAAISGRSCFSAVVSMWVLLTSFQLTE